MQLIDDSGTRQLQCEELDAMGLKAATGKLATRILELVARHPHGIYASHIAKELGEHEQKIYYHTRRMLKTGVLSVHHTEDARGGTAKVLTLSAMAFALTFGKFEPLARIATYLPEQVAYLSPFIEHGRLNARIVVGSPDPHGPEQARSRDANYAIDLGVFLGTFLTSRAPPSVVLDTELRDWNQNLIIIGGPVVNKAAERINTRSRIPYDRELKAFVMEGKAYGHDEIGVIAKMPNPYAKGKWILHIAGKRQTGTKAAILAFLTEFEQVCKLDVTIVEGLDADSDGVVDSVKFVE